MTLTCVTCLLTKTNKKWYYGTTCKACYMRHWRQVNPEASRQIEARRYPPRCGSEWRRKNPEKHRAWRKARYDKDPAPYIAAARARKGVCKRAMPKWLTAEQRQELSEVYRNRPAGYDVDHIVPLRGKEVCGLHVPWNLQYLPSAENSKKSNKF